MDLTQETAMTDLMKLFKTKCIQGAALLTPEAINLLLVLATIELALALLLSEDDKFMLLAKKFLRYSFLLWLVQNWATGMSLTVQFFDSFDKLGAKAAGLSTHLNDPAAIAGKGTYMAVTTLQGIWSLGITSIGTILIKVVLAVVIFLCFAYMAFEVFAVTVEFYIVATLTTILIPFAANKHTAFLAEKAIGAIPSLSMKMMVISFILCITLPFLASIEPIDPKEANIAEVFQVLIGSAGMAFLTAKVPALAQGLISGSPSLSGGDAINAARTAAGGAASVAKGAGSVAQGVAGGIGRVAGFATRMGGFVQSAVNTPGGRRADGSISLGGTAINMGRISRQALKQRRSGGFVL